MRKPIRYTGIIQNIAVSGGAVDDRRNTDTIRCCKTLNDLQIEHLHKDKPSLDQSYTEYLFPDVNTEEEKSELFL